MTINFIRVPAQNETCVYCTKRVSFTSSSMLAQSLAQDEACMCCTEELEQRLRAGGQGASVVKHVIVDAVVKHVINEVNRVTVSDYHLAQMAFVDKMQARMEARKR